MLSNRAIAGVLALAHIFGCTAAQPYHGPNDPRVKTAIVSNFSVTGVSTTRDGRVFLVIPRQNDGSIGPQIVEWYQDTDATTAFPDAEWNAYATGKDPASHFLNANAQRIGPDGYLYVVDTGSPSLGAPVLLPRGPKLVQINLQTNHVARVYGMGNATRYNSILDDVRFHPSTGKAYLTDAGSPGLIILDLATGLTKRVLGDDASTKGFMPISADGRLLYSRGNPVYIHADDLEVSPDGRWLYYSPASGGMSRVQTKYLDQAFYNSSLSEGYLSQYVEPFCSTPSTGGTAIDGNGTIYVSDTDTRQIYAVSSDGTKNILLQDSRLTWVDAMWVDSRGKLWMPAAQLNRGVIFGNGTNLIQRPLSVFTIDINVGPSSIDHA